MDVKNNFYVLFVTTLIGIFGVSFVDSLAYQVQPFYDIGDNGGLSSACTSAYYGLSCLNQDGKVGAPVQTDTVPGVGLCSSYLLKTPLKPNFGFWKCVVVNRRVPTFTNPDKVVIFGNDPLPTPPVLNPLLTSFVALGPSPQVDATFSVGEDTEITVTDNDVVNLYCTSDSNATLLYIWEYRNSSTGLWRVFSHAKHLSVKGVYGELWCTGWSRFGPARSKSTLTIKDGNAVAESSDLDEQTISKPLLQRILLPRLISSPVESVPPANVEAHTSTGEKELVLSDVDVVDLYCSSDQSIPSRYIWEYRDAATGLWRVFHHGGNLTVRGVYGELWCTAWNAFGPTKSKSSIQISKAQLPTPLLLKMPFATSFVAFPPAYSVDASFETELGTETVVTSADLVNLYCTSNATHPRYIWFYRNNATGEVRVYNNGQNVSAQGIYGEFWCSIWTRFGSVASKTTLQLLHAPEVVEISSSNGLEDDTTLILAKNETATLSCDSDAYPAATYIWERRTKALKPWKLYSLTQTIEITGKTSGQYSCVATNSLGSLRASEFVTVFKNPFLLSASNVDESELNENFQSGATAITGGIIAAVVLMLIAIGVSVKRYRHGGRGVYRELKRTSYHKDEDCKNAHEKTALVTAASNMC